MLFPHFEKMDQLWSIVIFDDSTDLRKSPTPRPPPGPRDFTWEPPMNWFLAPVEVHRAYLCCLLVLFSPSQSFIKMETWPAWNLFNKTLRKRWAHRMCWRSPAPNRLSAKFRGNCRWWLEKHVRKCQTERNLEIKSKPHGCFFPLSVSREMANRNESLIQVELNVVRCLICIKESGFDSYIFRVSSTGDVS